jgi:hypothetical protein
MARHKNGDWNLHDPVKTWDEVHAAILMDIRDELRTLNRLLACPNFIEIPSILRGIRTKLPPRAKRIPK